MNTAVIISADTLTAQRMNKLHREIVGAEKTAKEMAAELGEMLLAKKQQLKHGEFLPWIEKNCEFSDYTAKAYMRVARYKSEERLRFDACTSIREVLEIGKEPKGAAPTVTERTLSQVKALHAKAHDPSATPAEVEEAEALITKIAAKNETSVKQLLKKAKVDEPEPVKGGHEVVLDKAISKLASHPKKWLIGLLIKAAFGNSEAQQQVQTEIMKGL